MTGMPAWEMRHPDADLWAIVAFVKQLPRLTAADYEAMARHADVEGRTKGDGTAAQPKTAPSAIRDPRSALSGGNAGRGLYAMQQYACTTCHLIPGMVGANAHVGPTLAGIADRKYLGGRLPNTPENLVRWIRHPRETSPQSLMPDLGVSEQHARDMAAYLLTLTGGR
jgi:cytochrome c2